LPDERLYGIPEGNGWLPPTVLRTTTTDECRYFVDTADRISKCVTAGRPWSAGHCLGARLIGEASCAKLRGICSLSALMLHNLFMVSRIFGSERSGPEHVSKRLGQSRFPKPSGRNENLTWFSGFIEIVGRSKDHQIGRGGNRS